MTTEIPATAMKPWPPLDVLERFMAEGDEEVDNVIGVSFLAHMGG